MNVELNPLIEYKLQEILNIEKIKDCYELRLVLLRNNYSIKSEFEKNELDIKEVETKTIILKLNDKRRTLLKEFEESWCILEYANKIEYAE